MKVEEVVKVLTEFNKWRRGLPPYEWSEDSSTQNDLPYSSRDVGIAIDEAINMLSHADDMKRERKYEYAEGYTVDGHIIVRREVGEWEEVPNV